jgi:hypothetical protein
MKKAKDYNYESDIITTPDPIYRIGQLVKIQENWFDVFRVQYVVWNTLKSSWAYAIEHDRMSVCNVLEKHIRPVNM